LFIWFRVVEEKLNIHNYNNTQTDCKRYVLSFVASHDCFREITQEKNLSSERCWPTDSNLSAVCFDERDRSPQHKQTMVTIGTQTNVTGEFLNFFLRKKFNLF